MTQLLSPDTFEFFARYLLAGYVVIAVRSRFVVGEKPRATEVIAEAVIFSLLSQLVVEFLHWTFPKPIGLPERAQFFIEVVLIPAVLGLLLGLNLSKGWNNAFLRRLSMPIVSPIQRAHDYAFGENRRPCLVIVTYEDGTVIRGWFGPSSLAASDRERSDLYLERLYYVDDMDQWIELSPGRSALVSLAQVRSIEFLDPEVEQE